MRLHLLTALVFMALVSSACATAKTSAPPKVPAKPVPALLTEATLPEATRRFWTLGPQSPEREALRTRIVHYLLTKAPNPIGTDDYNGVVQRFAQISSFFTPAEIEAGQWPPELEPVARYLYERGSSRGDEARVLSALIVLGSTGKEPTHFAALYRQIRDWGFDSRAALSTPLDRFEEGIIEVWQEHARLTPTPQVLATLCRLYVERRNALVAMFQSSEHRIPFGAAVFEGVQRTALSVAAVYLRYGDVASALAEVQSMGSASGLEKRLSELLTLAKEDGNEGAGALLDLSRAYLEDGRADVARGLCLVGLRKRSDDARFPQCLARIAATESDFVDAMAWYAEAVRIVPEERALYDEILEVLSRLMEQGFGGDPAQIRAVATRASELLQERLKRWPNAPLAIRPEELYIAIAIADMNAGDAAGAEAGLRKSIELRPTLNGLLQLGILLERVNRAPEATAIYNQALQLSGDDSEDGEGKRAEILERLGDTQRMLGNSDEAGRLYQRGLALWDQNLARQKGQRIGLAHLRRGILLGRLSRRADSVSAFEKAMELAPEARETYATILAYLAVSKPDRAFADQVFHNALNQLSLEPEWKVYFGLWLRMIAGRAGSPSEPELEDLFQELGQGHDWWAALAQFAGGKLRFEALLSEASDAGERAEAYFYEGARRLSTGDADGARAMFQQVIDSRMINFYEYAMAQELMPSVGQKPK